MNDRLALLRGILDAPDDDAPRLVFADWLEEFGGEPERAEFIRVQCELANRPVMECHLTEFHTERVCVGLVSRSVVIPKEIFTIRHQQRDDSWYMETGFRAGKVEEYDAARLKVTLVHVDDALRRRERELLDQPHPLQSNWLAWAEPIRETGILLGRPWHENMEYRRGFVEWIRCSAADCLAHLDAIRAEHPIREVRLTTPVFSLVDMVRGRYLLSARPLETAYSNDCREVKDVPISFIRPTVERLLAAEWPGITFHLPEPTIRARRPRTRTTLRINGGAPIPVREFVILEDQSRQVTTEAGETLTFVPGVEWEISQSLEAEETAVRWDTGDYFLLHGDPDAPQPLGVMEMESPSAAPPDSRRRRTGHTRMPDWLADQRARPTRR